MPGSRRFTRRFDSCITPTAVFSAQLRIDLRTRASQDLHTMDVTGPGWIRYGFSVNTKAVTRSPRPTAMAARARCASVLAAERELLGAARDNPTLAN